MSDQAGCFKAEATTKKTTTASTNAKSAAFNSSRIIQTSGWPIRHS